MYDAVNGPPVAQSPSGRSLLPFSLDDILDDIQYKDVQSLRQSSEQSGLVLPLEEGQAWPNNCRTHAHTHNHTHTCIQCQLTAINVLLPSGFLILSGYTRL